LPKVSISISAEVAREIAESRSELGRRVKEIVLMYAERSRACRRLKYVFEVIEEVGGRVTDRSALKSIVKMVMRQVPLTNSERRHLELYLKTLDSTSNVEEVARMLMDYIAGLCRDYVR
jgi:hypothetical protein